MIVKKLSFHLATCFVLILYITANSGIFAQNKLADQKDGWFTEIRYVKRSTLDIFNEPTTSGENIGRFKMYDKILVVIEKRDKLELGWSKVIYPIKGYVNSNYLITENEAINSGKELITNYYLKDPEYISWEEELIYCKNEYSFVKEDPSYESKVIGITREGEKVVTISNKLKKEKLWIKILYPYEGYIKKSDFETDTALHWLSLGATFGIVHIPYERNLKNYRNPFGGFLDYSNSNNWGIRIGYNNAQSNLKEYILKTQVFYLQFRYTIFRIFNDELDTYIFAGGSYWKASFQNTKYPSLSDYFKEEEDSDFGYNFGVGSIYNFGGIFIGIQYTFFGMREGVFGVEPGPGEFGNQYKLYPGSNQTEVLLGYRFKL